MNENSILPLYYQFKSLITNKIKNDEWKVEDKIPSESELIAEYGVTHHTVIKALNELAKEGLIYTRKGKGRFVSPRKIVENLLLLESYTDSLKAKGIVPDVRTIDKTLSAPDEEIAFSLNLDENEKVIRIERLSYIDGVPSVHLLSYIPYKIAPSIMETDITNCSIYRILREVYSIELVKAQNYIEATFADQDIAAVLKIKEGTMIMVNEGISFTYNNTPVEYTRITYKGDKYKFYIESHKY